MFIIGTKNRHLQRMQLLSQFVYLLSRVGGKNNPILTASGVSVGVCVGWRWRVCVGSEGVRA